MADLIFVSLGTATTILAVLALSPPLIRRYGRKWRYWVWLLLAVRLLIPIRPELPSAPVTVQYVPEMTVSQENDREPAGDAAAVTVNTPEDVSAQERGQVNDSHSGIGILRAAALVWAAGAAVFFTAHIGAYAVFRYRIRNRIVPMGENAFICDAVEAPVMVGFLRPAVLLPDAEYTEEERDMVIAHEMTHWRRRDTWYKLILLAANAVHWFDPAVYLMVRRANEDIEYTCDDAVVIGKDDEYRRRYSRTILNTMGSAKEEE